ncbi:MAG: hypothetical protein AB7L09_00465 [Nitrospira sp.]
MFLNFQTVADIRNEIRIALVAIGRPATAMEIAAAIWFGGSIDGTRSAVYLLVNKEVLQMASDGDIERVPPPAHAANMSYFRAGALDRLAGI